MLRRPLIRFLFFAVAGMAYLPSFSTSSPRLTSFSTRSLNWRRSEPRTPSSRTSCLKPAAWRGWRSMWRRMVESEMGKLGLSKIRFQAEGEEPLYTINLWAHVEFPRPDEGLGCLLLAISYLNINFLVIT